MAKQLYRAPGLALPWGTWEFQAPVTGDASGGEATIVCTANAAISGKHIWSVEEVQAANSDAVARPFLIFWATGRVLQSGGNLSWNTTGTTHVLVGPGAPGALSLLTRRSAGGPPGTQSQLTSDLLVQRQGSTLLSLITQFANADTIVFAVQAWGYIWDKKLLDAGEQLVRPDGL